MKMDNVVILGTYGGSNKKVYNMKPLQKRIGILTFHRAINYGAFLQCYSLVVYLQENFPGYKVEIIDYETRDEFIIRVKGWLKYEGLKQYYEKYRRYRLFLRDLKRMMPLSTKRVVSNAPYVIKKCYADRYDAIVVGSDAVWNTLDFNKLTNFYLVGCNALKFSYAASTSGLDTKRLDPSVKALLNKSLGEFSYIGVREEKGEHFVKRLNVSVRVEHNCDPTCFLDLQKLADNIPEKMYKHGITSDRPIICLMTANKTVGKYVRMAYGKTHKIVSVYASNDYSDISLYDLSPVEFAVFFKYIDLMFSSFFHGCYLCMKNYKPVIAVDGYEESDGEKTKLKDLFQRLGIEERYFQLGTMRDVDYEEMMTRAKNLLGMDKDPILISALEKESTYVDTFRNSIHLALLSCIE